MACLPDYHSVGVPGCGGRPEMTRRRDTACSRNSSVGLGLLRAPEALSGEERETKGQRYLQGILPQTIQSCFLWKVGLQVIYQGGTRPEDPPGGVVWPQGHGPSEGTPLLAC